MLDLRTVLLPILLADAINPALFAFMVYVADSIIVISEYNLGYVLPFLVVSALAFFLGERSQPILARTNEKVGISYKRHSNAIHAYCRRCRPGDRCCALLYLRSWTVLDIVVATLIHSIAIQLILLRSYAPIIQASISPELIL